MYVFFVTFRERIRSSMPNKEPNNNRSHKDLTDEELIRIIVQDGEAILYGYLYERYSLKVYNKCYSFVKNPDEAKDLVQDVFLRAYLKLKSYNPDKAAFSTWLYVVTYNLCANYVTRDRKKSGSDDKKLDKKLKEEAADEDVDIEEMNGLDSEKLKLALDKIAPEDKALLLLKYQDDTPIKEIEALLGVRESAVKMRLNRAKLKVIKTYNSIA